MTSCTSSCRTVTTDGRRTLTRSPSASRVEPDGSTTEPWGRWTRDPSSNSLTVPATVGIGVARPSSIGVTWRPRSTSTVSPSTSGAVAGGRTTSSGRTTTLCSSRSPATVGAPVVIVLVTLSTVSLTVTRRSPAAMNQTPERATRVQRRPMPIRRGSSPSSIAGDGSCQRPTPSRPKTAAAVVSTASASVCSSTSFKAATKAPMSGMRAGEFGVPRCGWGDKKGESVSRSMRSRGQRRAAACTPGALVNVTVPENDSTAPRSR